MLMVAMGARIAGAGGHCPDLAAALTRSRKNKTTGAYAGGHRQSIAYQLAGQAALPDTFSDLPQDACTSFTTGAGIGT